MSGTGPLGGKSGESENLGDHQTDKNHSSNESFANCLLVGRFDIAGPFRRFQVSLLLPPERLAILCHLTEFLTQIIQEESNMMDAEALSRLFGPCIFGTERLPSPLHPFEVETALKNYVRLLLQHRHLLGVCPEEFHAVAATPQKKFGGSRKPTAEAGSLYSLRKLQMPNKMSIKRSKSLLDRSRSGSFSKPKKSKASGKGVLHSLVQELSKARAIVPSFDRAPLEKPHSPEWKSLFSPRRNLRIVGK